MGTLTEKDKTNLEMYEKMLISAKSAKKQKAIDRFEDKISRLKSKENTKERLSIDYSIWRI